MSPSRVRRPATAPRTSAPSPPAETSIPTAREVDPHGPRGQSRMARRSDWRLGPWGSTSRRRPRLRAMTVLRGRLVTPSHDGPAEVRVEDDRIAAITPIEDAATDDVILPGLVDIHCHGGGGASFTSGSAHEARSAALHHLHHGTTTLLGSLVTDAPDRLLSGVE